nr:protein Star-like [Cherax quadricarinatus]
MIDVSLFAPDIPQFSIEPLPPLRLSPHVVGSASPPGFFIEAGALDGQYLSNTLHLEKVYGWRGLLVEANPSAYQQLVKKNRKAWSSNTCLAVTPYPKEMVLEMLDTHEGTETTQALWVIRGSSFLSEAGGPDQRYQAQHYETTYAMVQCFPLLTYLRALNLTKVDLLSLDVEGAEKMILDTIPWKSVDISIMLIEHHGDVKGKDLKFVDSVQDKGYDLFDYQIDKDNIGDYIFVKKGYL